MSYDIATKKSSLIKEYNVVNRLFLQNGYLWICGLWNDIVCHDLKTHKEQVISINKVLRTEYFKDTLQIWSIKIAGLFIWPLGTDCLN